MIIVTGGAGFIGANFILDWLNNNSSPVVNLDMLTYAGNPENLSAVEDDPRYTFIHGDIGDRKLIAKICREYNPLAIVNFAAESHVDRSITGPAEFIATNVTGTFNLLDETYAYWRGLNDIQKNEFRFLHVSTDEVYGSLNLEDPAFTETSPFLPNSPYAASKASSDHLVRSYHHTYGFPTLTTNCSNNYGPYQFPEKLIPLLIQNCLKGLPLPIYGDGSNIRDWLYVGDHCSAIREVLAKGRTGGTYNIGGNSELTNIQVVQAVCRILDKLLPESPHLPHEKLITYVEDRPGHDRRYAINAKKIETELGWQPMEIFERGLEKTVSWYLENQEWSQRVAGGEYRQWLEKNYSSRKVL